MRKILLLLALALPSWGAVTFTITNGDGTNGGSTCTMKGLRGGYTSNGPCRVILGGSGPYTTHDSDQFWPEVKWCKPVFSGGTITDCTAHPSGTLTGTENPPTELRLYYDNDNEDQTASLGAHCTLATGDNTCTFHADPNGILLNATEISVTVILRNRVAPPVTTTANRQTAANLVSAGCSSTPLYPYPDLCPQITPTAPNATYDPPAAGGTIVDERYGTRGCLLAFNVVEAPIQRYISAGGKYVILKAFGAGFTDDGIYDMDTCTKVYDYPGSVSGCQFPTDLSRLQLMGLPELTLICYGSVGNTIVRLRQPASGTTLTNDGIKWTSLHGEAMIQDGGSSTLTSNGKKVFYGCPSSSGCGQNGNPISNYRYFYMIDVYTFQTIADMDMLDARVAAGFGSITAAGRAVLVTDKGPDGRYAIQIGNGVYPAMYLWCDDSGNWGTSGLENDFTGDKKWSARGDCATYTFYCTGVVHQTPTTISGNSVWVKSTSEGGPKAGGFSNSLLSTPIERSLPIEYGGGGSMIHFPVEHLTSAVVPYSLIVGSVEPAGADNPQMPILSITTANPAVITLDETKVSQSINPLTSIPGLIVGGQIYVGCYGRTSGSTQQIQGFYTVSAIQTSPYRLTLSGFNFAGTPITSRRCSATLKAVPATDQTPLHIAIVRFAPFGNGVRAIQIAPIAKQPSTHMYGDADCGEYFCSQTKPQLAPNGKYVTATTNWGQPNGLSTIRYEVPWQLRATRPYELAPGYPVVFTATGSGNMSVSARVPTSDTLTCTVSTTPDLTTSPTTITMNGPGVDRTSSFSGTPKTNYHWFCRTTQTDHAAVGIAVPL